MRESVSESELRENYPPPQASVAAGGEFAFVTISNFSFDDGFGEITPMPVPPAFLLFGTALAGLGFFRKKKAAA